MTGDHRPQERPANPLIKLRLSSAVSYVQKAAPNRSPMCQMLTPTPVQAARCVVILLLTAFTLRAGNASAKPHNRSLLALAGIHVGRDTDQEVARRFGDRGSSRSASRPYFHRYYIDRYRKLTLHVASDTDEVSLVEVRAGLHVPKQTTARVIHYKSPRLSADMRLIAGLRLGSSREDVLLQFGSPRGSRRHPGAGPLRYSDDYKIKGGATAHFESLFEFKNNKLVHIRVYNPTLI